MRKRDKLKKKQAKMTINQLQKQYRKGAQRAIANGTITAKSLEKNNERTIICRMVGSIYTNQFILRSEC